MVLCDYGCGQEAIYQFKNGKQCCSKSKNSCPAQKLLGDKNPSKRKDVRKLLGLKEDLNPAKRPEVKEQIRQSILEKYKDPIYVQHCKDGKKREPLVGNLTILCSYGCENLAKYQFKNGNYCCSKESSECQVIAKKNPGTKGRKQTEESNKKRSESWTVERRERKSKELEERWEDPKYRERQRELCNGPGPNNGNWKGGFSPYPPDFNGYLIELIKERDNYLCQNPLCKKITKKLAVHHIDYNKDNCSNLNLITICNSCNSRANGKREYWKTFYQEIVKSK